MSRIACRSSITLLMLFIGVGWMVTDVSGQSPTKDRMPARSTRSAATVASTSNGTPVHSTKNGEWPHYTGNLDGSRYSPLDQINADNFNKLEVAWRFKTDNLGTRPEYKLEGTPLMVN